MKLAILSRNSSLYSTRRLVEAAGGHLMLVASQWAVASPVTLVQGLPGGS